MSALDSLIASKKFAALGPASRYLALMLWAGPKMPPEGIGRMSRAAIVDFTGVDKTLDATMAALREVKLLTWDAESGLMWAFGRANVEPWSVSKTKKSAAALALLCKQVVTLPPWVPAAVHRIASCHPLLGARLAVCWWPFPTNFRVPAMPPAEPELRGVPASAVDVLREDAEAVAQADAPPMRDADMAALVWNEMAAEHGLAQATVMHPARVKALMAAVAQVGGMRGWSDTVGGIGESDWLCGRVPGKNFKATLDWVINPVNFTKIVEGNYVNRTARTDNGPSADAERLRQGLEDALVRQLDAGRAPAGGGRPILH